MNECLYHHGVKGMKWGVRRFPKKYVTLNSTNKKQKSASESKTISDDEMHRQIKKHKLQKEYNKMLEEQTPMSNLEKTKKLVDSSNDMINKSKNMVKKSQVKTTMDLSNMTDKELRDKINRAHLERQYNDLFGTVTVSKGEEYVSKILETTGDILTIGGSALALALTIKELKS